MPLTRIQSLGITDGTIVNADINANAAIAGTKLSGAGKVLQVVSVSTTTTTVSTSTSFADLTGLSASITPSSASNKILVHYFLNGSTFRGSSGYFRGWIKILRGATNIKEDIFGGYLNVGTDNNAYGGFNSSIIDSPNSTSSLTYKLQSKVDSGGSFTVQSDASSSSILILMEIAA